MHGMTMIFLFIVPMWAGFANYLVPLMIGARDMAFPKLNALSFWLLAAGGLVFYASIFFSPPECGWTCYAPLNEKEYLPSGGVDAWIFLAHLTGLSSLVGAVNFYATIANMRTRAWAGDACRSSSGRSLSTPSCSSSRSPSWPARPPCC
jgi:cytochrome c oxidase subunit 1